MKAASRACLVTVLIFCILVFSSCVVISNCCPQEEYTRTMPLSSPINDGALFKAKTHNGYIKIEAADISQCDIVATIKGRAKTIEVAQELAEKVNVSLVPGGDSLLVKIDKPTTKNNESVSVSLDVKLPKQVALSLFTHNGSVVVSGTAGPIDATTHNGKVEAIGIEGDVELETHNGQVVCSDFIGNAHLLTHNGGVNLSYLDNAPSVCKVHAETHNGSITFKAPPAFSASAFISTHNGSIHTDLPVLAVGKLSKNKITGKIGSGEGKLHLKTHNGSIRIK